MSRAEKPANKPASDDAAPPPRTDHAAVRMPPWARYPDPEPDPTADAAAMEAEGRSVVARLEAGLAAGQVDHRVVRKAVTLLSSKGYTAAANQMAADVWTRAEDFRRGNHRDRVVRNFLSTVVAVLPVRGAVHVLRQFARHRSGTVRGAALRLAADLGAADKMPRPVGRMRTDAAGKPADAQTTAAARPPTTPGPALPPVPTVGALRALLKIPTRPALGFMLLACHARAAADGRPAQQGPYRIHTIPKRDGSPRTICAPSPALKRVQRRILDEIVAHVPAADAAHGFVVGRSIATNAAPHVGKAVVLRFDLKDFFPSVSYHRVRGFFSSLGYPGGPATRFDTADDSDCVAQVLARLCCYTDNPAAWGGGGLPQGSPASPGIANLVCRKLDARMAGAARSMGAAYTRYADDLTFSFADPKAPVGRLKWMVDQIATDEGFVVNPEKFRVLRKGARQIVTGVVVNDVMRAPNEVRRWLRAVVHNCRVHGVASQAARFAQTEGVDVDFVSHVRGLASYLHMVAPGTAGDLLAEAVEATATAE